MKTARTTILKGILATLVLTGLASTGMAQFGNQSAVRDVVRSIQTRTDSLQRVVQNASDRNAYRVDDLNRLISDFEVAFHNAASDKFSLFSNLANNSSLLDKVSLTLS